MKLIKSEQRGHADHGWLKTYHSFSFAEYHNPEFMQFSSLRVLNEDMIAPNTGFGMHAHRDMEIVTYIISGALKHQDSMGNSSVIRAGDVQRMTAGTGIRHSEFNASGDEAVHLLQIWLFPNQKGLSPSYQEEQFSQEQKQNVWCLLVSGKAHADTIYIHQDVDIYASILQPSCTLTWDIKPRRCAYLHVVSGELMVGQQKLLAGDAAIIMQELGSVEMLALKNTECVLFDLLDLNE